MKHRLFIIFLIIIFQIILLNISLYCQENENFITENGLPDCYKLKSDQTLDPLELKGKYKGKVLLNAKCDTINETLIDFIISYAKLESIENTNDSIEIRLESKIGNFKFIEENEDKIIKHASSLKIEKTSFNNCLAPIFSIIVRIEPEK